MPAPSWRLSGPGSEAGSPPRRTPSSSCSYMAGSTTRGPTTLIFWPFKGYLKDRKARSGSVKMDWGRCPVGSWSPGWLARHVALRSFWPFRQYNFLGPPGVRPTRLNRLVREFLGRFRHYHNHRKDKGGAPLFIVVGHSFGGMIVYSALAQSLIEATSVPADEVTPRFADLVLLVNPAIERARYLPIYDLAQVRTFAGRSSAQPPVFICATATNDWATGLALPIGNAKLTILLVTPVLRDTRSPSSFEHVEYSRSKTPMNKMIRPS